jgi:parvulin-like peptidyl-prolyl isomerase
MPSLLRDPLLHFLAAGLVLFIAGSALKPAAAPPNSIVIDRDSLITFIQYRSKAFEPDAAAAILDRLDDAGRARLIRDFVREEALAREAEALGLSANDYVIRQRLVQKVEFLAEAAATTPDVTPGDAKEFYAANAERYRSPPAATLTHVFVSTERKTAADAKAEAEGILKQLRDGRATFTDATAYGDRFLFHKNYVDRTRDYIESQLGAEAVAAAFKEETPLNAWLGPFRSDYGWHVIFVTARTPARLAPFEEISDLVRSDLEKERRQLAINRAVDEIVARYEVVNKLVDNR